MEGAQYIAVSLRATSQDATRCWISPSQSWLVLTAVCCFVWTLGHLARDVTYKSSYTNARHLQTQIGELQCLVLSVSSVKCSCLAHPPPPWHLFFSHLLHAPTHFPTGKINHILYAATRGHHGPLSGRIINCPGNVLFSVTVGRSIYAYMLIQPLNVGKLECKFLLLFSLHRILCLLIAVWILCIKPNPVSCCFILLP